MSDAISPARPPLRAWALEFARRWNAGVSSVFVLHGNIHDVFAVPEGAKSGYAPLKTFLTRRLFTGREWLLRADSIATRNSAALTARIDATVEHLEQTNQWLSQMDQFRELTADLPLTAQRAGFGEKTTPPPIPQRGKERA